MKTVWQVMKADFLAQLLVLCGLAAACGNSTPSTPSRTVSTLTLSPATDWVKIKGTEKFSVTALYSTGVSEPVTPAWNSDNGTVATVDASGTVTGQAAGQATITASYQGATAARPLRVIPDYAGQWKGNWLVSSCSVQGDFQANWCDPLRNGSFPAALDVIQTKDVVSGTWTFQEATGTHPGTIANDGRLSLTGSTLQNGVNIEISNWQTVTTDNKNMTGTFTLTWTTPGGKSGSAQTTVTLQNFVKQ